MYYKPMSSQLRVDWLNVTWIKIDGRWCNSLKGNYIRFKSSSHKYLINKNFKFQSVVLAIIGTCNSISDKRYPRYNSKGLHALIKGNSLKVFVYQANVANKTSVPFEMRSPWIRCLFHWWGNVDCLQMIAVSYCIQTIIFMFRYRLITYAPSIRNTMDAYTCHLYIYIYIHY